MHAYDIRLIHRIFANLSYLFVILSVANFSHLCYAIILIYMLIFAEIFKG